MNPCLVSGVIIAVFRLTRCVAVLRSKFPVTASCPLVYGRASLSARSAKVPSTLPRMPQTHKSRNAPACEASCSVEGGSSADEAGLVPQEENQAAGDAGGGEDNVGDGEIIKSPSDPKQYR